MLQGLSPVLQCLLGTLLTWGLTALGAAFVFVFQGGQRKVLDASLGFAAGVMLAASYWSLLAPAVEMAEASHAYGPYSFLPPCLGFMAGAAFVYLADLLLPILGYSEPSVANLAAQAVVRSKFSASKKEELGTESSSITMKSSYSSLRYRNREAPGQSSCPEAPEDRKAVEGLRGSSWRRILLLIIAITVHNIPDAERTGKAYCMFEFKESQKKGRKEHQQIMEKSRKLVQSLEASIEKTRSSLLGGSKAKVQKKSSKQEEPNLARRRSSVQGDDLKKLEDSYNHAQTQWIDNMINACQDYEQQEDERSDFLKDMLFKYIDRCVAVDESSAESLSRVTDSVERINKQADREYFIKVNGTGTQRPVDATFTT